MEVTADIHTEVARRWADDLWGRLDHAPSNGVMQATMRENFDEGEMRTGAAIRARRSSEKRASATSGPGDER